ncbi:dehydrogenase of uncharacterised specificity, short-chain alcohol dehydrogenase like protein [Mycobacteroides abscessus subsp. abscessus]|uniref:SDR family NAD(P)-dependent oxidoreductase n=1 Tax=Mycobacteroides abscessus TaxID=36809 RepID=UPI000927527A|nr:SDR family oxidoreductase [Mycobacteroides abscessus]MDM2349431.1 SDR family NAD(P)-dependent oxidoreductase [Mycobacteroides abscessus]MDM2357743.1 SDR family NAD(P)-dependent oxidoreductase [Mycobacteroides abscessus]SID40198.1 dehydrogenase of uncharacterised specificity, short-chain alcohol dehydrogenase like protein [Mycobacteroides abscessus subsp. abscessus]SKU69620.1 dehydrogenase of uncharacterised specificity, short-chain alcohol dehydrogenase like protein [Mycobacteroides abscessu
MTRRVVVSGGGTGIGKAVARRLAAEGDHVVIIGRRPHVLQATAQQINTELGTERITTATADLTAPDQVQRLSDQIAEGENIDVLINNAGGNATQPITDLGTLAQAYLDSFRLNVITAVLLTEALIPRMTRPGGRIISISSIVGLRGSGTPGAYGAAKSALHGWTMGLARQLAPQAITANIVAPGFVPNTDLWTDTLNPTISAHQIAQIPLGRAGTPDEIAAAIAYLASPDAGWTTGQILQVNGGALLGRG